jgi:hypothetical protein
MAVNQADIDSVLEFTMSEKNHSGMLVSRFEKWRRKLIKLGLGNNLVHAATPLFANANSPHE